MPAMIAPPRIGMPMDAFINEYSQQPFELIDGEQLSLMPNVAKHQLLLKFLVRLLTRYEEQYGSIFVAFELPFVLTDNANWVLGSRVPDMMVYAMSRFTAYQQTMPDWEDKPIVLVPDLCIEIVSPNDIYQEVEDKVARFLDDGVRIVWVVNPRRKTVTVYYHDGRILRFSSDMKLPGDDLMPDLDVIAASLFV
jgi:Uma2 family endonuclease